MMFPISIGAQLYFAEGAETLAANMLEARPTIMTAVPRLYETLHQRILRGVERQGGMKARLFMRALELGKKRYHGPRTMSWRERIEDHDRQSNAGKSESASGFSDEPRCANKNRNGRARDQPAGHEFPGAPICEIERIISTRD